MRICAEQLNGSEPWLADKWDGTWEEIKEVSQSLATAILALREMEYSDYLQTNHWRAVVSDVWRNQRGQCDLCTKQISDVHHLIYERRGFERDRDVVGLCREHHEMQHATTRKLMKLSLFENP